MVKGKRECPLLQGKGKTSQVKSAGLVATVPIVDTAELVAPFQMQVKPIDTSWVDMGYAPFMSDGFVTLIGGDKKVPVRILRDSGGFA